MSNILEIFNILIDDFDPEIEKTTSISYSLTWE